MQLSCQCVYSVLTQHLPLQYLGMACTHESDCGSLFSGTDMNRLAGQVAGDSEQDSVGATSPGQSGPGRLALDDSSANHHQQRWFQCGFSASTDSMLNIGNNRSHRWVCHPCNCVRVAFERQMRKMPELQETLKCYKEQHIDKWRQKVVSCRIYVSGPLSSSAKEERSQKMGHFCRKLKCH